MAQSPNITTREFNKFVESPTRPGQSAVEITGSIVAGSGPFEPPVNCDNIQRLVAGPVETYEYKQGMTLLKTVTVTYTAANLKELVSVVVS